eukprot:gene256-337_t
MALFIFYINIYNTEKVGHEVKVVKNVEDAISKGTRLHANKLHHIFEKPEHALENLVAKSGSQEAVYNAVQRAANQALRNGELVSNAKKILPSDDLGHIINVEGINYPTIKSHIPLLRIRSREATDLVMYVNFCYLKSTKIIPNLEFLNGSISTNANIEIPELKYRLGYELDITDGLINFIEFISYGEGWNGKIEKFKFA